MKKLFAAFVLLLLTIQLAYLQTNWLNPETKTTYQSVQHTDPAWFIDDIQTCIIVTSGTPSNRITTVRWQYLPIQISHLFPG
ncbi:hypothetical protein N6H18_08275 [Reichenbachiella agarivorans]|uniref:Uncharacterized protein n=1 Tax=Reichenbachiella agarivorans TaxID=2979464 RepID=A0ABY6CTT7_9BACT|nr:hypothetical protein [Reichenbachiella agarivorans]UXP33939.1 hypothetical protein N6H18_08275 [Reichenbachiella agarivorans]